MSIEVVFNAAGAYDSDEDVDFDLDDFSGSCDDFCLTSLIRASFPGSAGYESEVIAIRKQQSQQKVTNWLLSQPCV